MFTTRTLAAEQATARTTAMAAYRAGRAPRANDFYLPFRIDAIGLYRVTGPSIGFAGNPLDGFYVVDDFGGLARVDAATVLARMQ